MRAKLPREAMLTRESDFKKIYRSGKRINVSPLRARTLRRPSEPETPAQSRLGLAVGRRIGGATVRNHWKRAIREAFRLHRHELPAPCDIIIAVDWGTCESDIARVEPAFLKIVDALRRDD